mmetsp:Transcript_60189/g.125923  ORF Transcript_60189/g.125923 Transcript_60189/m.125923 type:complete len:200 (-) Transcript_60189:363-962(-)
MRKRTRLLLDHWRIWVLIMIFMGIWSCLILGIGQRLNLVSSAFLISASKESIVPSQIRCTLCPGITTWPSRWGCLPAPGQLALYKRALVSHQSIFHTAGWPRPLTTDLEWPSTAGLGLRPSAALLDGWLLTPTAGQRCTGQANSAHSRQGTVDHRHLLRKPTPAALAALVAAGTVTVGDRTRGWWRWGRTLAGFLESLV